MYNFHIYIPPRVVLSVPGDRVPPTILFVTVIRFSFVVDDDCLLVVPVVKVVVGINSGNVE